MIHKSNEPENMDELMAALSIGEVPFICADCWDEKFFPNMTEDDAKLYFRVMVSGEWDPWPASWMGKFLQIKESDLSGPMFCQLIEKADLQALIPYQGKGIEFIGKYGPYYYGVVMLATHYFASERSDTQLYLIRAKTLASIFAMVITDKMISEAMGELYQLEEETKTKFPVDLLRAIVGDAGEKQTMDEIKEYKKGGGPLDQLVIRAIQEWMAEHGNNVSFYGGFVAFDEEGEVIEDRYLCYGGKKTLQISIDEFLKEFAKEKDGFVNW